MVGLRVLWLPDDHQVPRFEHDVTRLRQEHNCWGEFKWSKLSNAYLPAYQDFLALGLALPDLRFTSLVVDTQLLGPEEMKRYHDKGGLKEAYLKFMSLLIRKRLPDMVR